MMSHRNFKEELVKQLIYFDENTTELLNVIPNFPDRSHSRHLIKRYCQQIESYLDGHNSEGPATMVWIGSQIVVHNELEKTDEILCIVLPRDADPALGRISVLSPVGQRLLLLRIDESAEIECPGESYILTIKSLSY